MGFNTDLLKEIWLKHIEVQERVLQLNSAPLAVEPDSINVSGQRLKLIVSQTDELDSKINKVKAFFGVSDDAIDSDSDTITCDGHFEAHTSEIAQLATECQKYYIQLSTNPVIDGVIRSQKSSFLKCVKALKEANIQYSVDNSRRLQVSVDALRILDKEHSFLHDILPEKASGIFSVSPTPAYFLRKWLSLKCKHEIKYQTVKYEDREERRLRRFLSIKNDYFSEAALHKLNTIWGLRLFSFDNTLLILM